MQIMTSYKARIKGWIEHRIVYDNKGKPVRKDRKIVTNPVFVPVKKSILDGTAEKCREILEFSMNAINESWDSICGKSGKERFNAAENLLHRTKENEPAFPEFDKKYSMLPSYMRRSVIQDALGKVTSFRSNHENWENAGRKGTEPSMGMDVRYQPTFYKDDRKEFQDHENWIQLRLWTGKEWRMETVVLDKHDIRYVRKLRESRTLKSPSIECVRGTYYIRFAFEENPAMDKNYSPLAEDTRIAAIDLGINNAATMCIMDAKGTVYARRIVKLAGEKGLVWHYLGLIKKGQQRGFTDDRMYRFARNANKTLSQRTAAEILAFAEENHVQCIVFEHLDVRGKKRGSRRERLHRWKCKEVQAIVERKAHQKKIRISHICAWGTSKLAFDGSGRVERGKYKIKGKEYYNYSICVFPTGKTYHADLNASYNIGARYFLRAYHEKYNNVEVSMPQRTLATLRMYVVSMPALKAA